MIKLFTDSDLDGIGCGLLAKMAFKENLDIVYCTYRNLDARMKKFLESPEHKQTIVYVTDLAVNKENERKLAQRYDLTKKVQMIDHHVTALHFNEYDWGFVKVTYDNGKKTCATALFYQYLVDKKLLTPQKSMDAFVELIRQYDTWEWETSGNITAKRLNDLFSIVGRQQFEQEMFERLTTNNDSFSFSKNEQMLLDMEEQKIERYIASKNRQLVQLFINDYCVGIVHAENYHSELGNALNKKNPHLDLIAIINIGSKAIGFRTIHDHIDVAKFAESFGGGGHQKASGCSLTEDTLAKFVIEPFTMEAVRPDPELNQYNIKASKYGTWYEANNGSWYCIKPANKKWEIYAGTSKKIGVFQSFSEAERYMKRNFAAALLYDKEFINKVTKVHGIHESQLIKNFEQEMMRISATYKEEK